MKSSGKSCEYILDSTSYLSNISSIQMKELFTTIKIYPFYNPWEINIQTLGPCRTKLIPYEEMVFTNDIVNIRNINIEQGQTIQIQCNESYNNYLFKLIKFLTTQQGCKLVG